MPEEPEDDQEVPQLGGKPEGRIQRYFCIDDDKCQALSRVSKDTEVIKRTRKIVTVMGKVKS